MRPLWVLTLCLASGLAGAEPPDERTRLAAERQAVTQRFDQEEQACRQKFASTGCLADVRARRREALAPLRERELSLADQDRQQRAQERRRSLAAKQQAAAERPVEAPAPVLKLRQAPPPADSASAAPTPRTDDQGVREAEAAQRAQANARRQAEIEAGKKRVADRVAARASEGKPVQPLPPLPAASGSRAGQPQR
jgi:hypothetical protein